jgi:SEC-C motif
MSLFKNWSDMVVEYVKQNGEDAFWAEYSQIEKKIYIKVLSKPGEVLNGTVKDLASESDVKIEFFMGFLDGINDSLKNSLELDELKEDSVITIDVDLEKLYFNMLDSKADYLYTLPQWDSIFSKEKRKEIQVKWRESKILVNEAKIGRNDPCPCGSGKKYKKCCGK